MRYHERLNIIFMRDNGPRRSMRVRRSHFYLVMAFFCSLPFICAALGYVCWHLWQANIQLQQNVEKFEEDYQTAETRAERLEHLEALLEEENLQGREMVLRQLAAGNAPVPVPSQDNNPPEKENITEGPGHEEFPAIDSGAIQIRNVLARSMRGNRLRISLDLQNQKPEKVLSGEVKVMLVTAAGEEKALEFMPEDVGNFRINRFKRSVMTARVPAGLSLTDSRIILEVLNVDGEKLFRNIYQVRN